uniref:Uncharacterized protein n=1 Tax=Cycas taitungensis TaxID=54799 RepID=A6H5I1_CYCTA|nr:hypothetical protein CYtaCp039 [Cycas taitungensis]BAF64947.1 hypothetical protein [Cycas taitungensis]
MEEIPNHSADELCQVYDLPERVGGAYRNKNSNRTTLSAHFLLRPTKESYSRRRCPSIILRVIHVLRHAAEMI